LLDGTIICGCVLHSGISDGWAQVDIKMDYFSGDYYGRRCRSDKKSSNIFNDYLDLLDGVACAEDELNWQLNNCAIAEEFESWERHML
jgi:hypothetical protein